MSSQIVSTPSSLSTVSLLAPNAVPREGSALPYTVTVSYHGDYTLEPSSIDESDISVTDGSGTVLEVSLVNINSDSRGNPANVSYAIDPPGGTWDASDSGPYRITLEPNAVRDIDFNFYDSGSLGTFDFEISTVVPTENIVFPDDSGIIDVTDFGALPNDGIDDTAAIQQALDENPSGNTIFYLPNGVYDISAPLVYAGSQKRNILQGQSRDGTILKLQDNSGLDSAIIFTGSPPAQRFRNSIRDLTVDIGVGNPDASGISYIANNQGTLSNVKIISRDGQGQIGLDLAPDENGPAFIENLEVIGFDVGIRTLNPTASLTFENIRLEGQNQYGWTNFNETIFVRGLESVNAVPALWNQPNGLNSVTLIDANLQGVGNASNEAAVYNEEQLYVRNLNTSGYEFAIDGNFQQPDGFVEEAIARGEFQTLFDSPQRSLNLDIRETPEVPWDALSQWASPLAFGGVPSDGIDDTAAIQAAIDSGATTVYLPNGTWQLEGELELRNNVRRFLGTEAQLQTETGAVVRLGDGTASTVVFERIEAGGIEFLHDSDRTWVLSSLFVSSYRNTANGTGDLFVQDVTGGPWEFENQNVWARQFNPEVTRGGVRVKNDGGNLWIFGYKTEDEGTLVETLNGGQTEVIGAYILNGDFGNIPAFINTESSVIDYSPR
ncbi:glycosyl hydrolase family 28-related protein [Baaleninema sp.]|uniref:glycoside hydrolase family 55 protein n=1 Tax=Baaleninema sp. TaxID=3101197 RepID=UPI003D073EF4